MVDQPSPLLLPWFTRQNNYERQKQNEYKVKYFGITITNGLKWNTHVSTFCTKANWTLGFLTRNLAACQRDVNESAYKGMVHAVLEYGSSVWDTQSILLQDELEKVQKGQLGL